jgi:hypothetical protein
MTTHRALVIPPDLAAPMRIIEFTEGTLLGQLYAEIGCDCVDSSPRLSTPVGEMYMWVDDGGLLAEEVVHNDRAIVACRGVGYMIPDVGGVAVFTGGADEEGNTLGLGEALIDEFAHAFGEPERVVTVSVDTDRAAEQLDDARAAMAAADAEREAEQAYHHGGGQA